MIKNPNPEGMNLVNFYETLWTKFHEGKDEFKGRSPLDFYKVLVTHMQLNVPEYLEYVKAMNATNNLAPIFLEEATPKKLELASITTRLGLYPWSKDVLLVNKAMFIRLLARLHYADPININYRSNIILKSLEFDFKDYRYFKYLNDLYSIYNSWLNKTYPPLLQLVEDIGEVNPLLSDYEPVIFPGEVDKT